MSKGSIDQQALTIRANGGISNVLICDVVFTTPFIGNVPSGFKSVQVKGIWDTGATGTVITEKVVNSLGLKPIGITEVETANGKTTANVYLVNVILPSNVIVQSVRVTEGKLNNIDALIGMDILNLGDFSITNHNGNTVMSFRTPSCHEIDYVKDIDRQKTFSKYLPKPKKRQSKRKK